MAFSEKFSIAVTISTQRAHFDRFFDLINQPQLFDPECRIRIGLGVSVINRRAWRDNFDYKISRGSMFRIKSTFGLRGNIKEIRFEIRSVTGPDSGAWCIELARNTKASKFQSD